jgi:hypothetical protein
VSWNLKIVVRFNPRERPIKRKTVIGPLFRLRDRIYLLLSIVVPGPHNWRVEPHIVYDESREVNLERDGELFEVTGNVVLAKHEGLEQAFYEGYQQRAFPSYHIAPWGIAALVPPLEAKRPEKEMEAALYGLEVWRVAEWAKRSLLGRLEVLVEGGSGHS